MVIKSLLVLIVISFLALLFCQPAYALSEEQRKVIDSGVRYFNVEDEILTTGGCTTESTTLVGADNAEKIWNYFIGKGMSPVQTAAVMGNIQKESGFDPGRTEIGGGGGYGLIQWTGSRRTALEQAAAEQGVPVADLMFQLDYLWGEMQGMLETFLQMTDLREATLYFHDTLERSADGSEGLNKRVGFAGDILVTYGSRTGGTSSGGTVVCSTSGGQVVGGFSLPVDRRWYDEHPEWFTKPHHNYPAADILVPTGTPIYSISSGTVITAPTSGNCGVGLVIDMDNGVRFVYCHGSDGGSVDGARQGDKVQPGQLIMHSASTGRSSVPHLHVEVIVGGQQRCPQDLLVGIATGSVPALESLPSSGCTY